MKIGRHRRLILVHVTSRQYSNPSKLNIAQINVWTHARYGAHQQLNGDLSTHMLRITWRIVALTNELTFKVENQILSSA